jgi:hypothetical protein
LTSLITHAAPSLHTGRYRISPLSRRQSDGAWLASVSIRSGRGSACTDRVMRFSQPFPSQESACDYARAQGLIWIRHTDPDASRQESAWSD